VFQERREVFDEECELLLLISFRVRQRERRRSPVAFVLSGI
jgi:hypothetical protein